MKNVCQGCRSTNLVAVIRTRIVGKARTLRSGVRLSPDLTRMYRCRDCEGSGPENPIGSEFMKSTTKIVPDPKVVASLKMLRRSGLVFPWERGTENRY